MDNIANRISSQNKKVTNSDNETMVKHAIVVVKAIVHQTIIVWPITLSMKVKTINGINELSTKDYFGISETEFKSRQNNLTRSFRTRTHENDTKLLKYIWSLKEFKIRALILNSPFLKNLLDIVLYQNRVIFVSCKNQ